MLKVLTAASRRRDRACWIRRASAWERWEPVLLHSLASVNPALLRALDLRPGRKVVDFGCGSGDPALEIARWVGPRGTVLGLDASSTMLETARRRARLLDLDNVRFRRADLARYSHSGPRFDSAVSRFSLMFADDIPRALECMRAALKPGGPLAAAVWGPVEENPGTQLRAEAARPFRTGPEEDPEESANPHRLARPGLLPRLMRRAGFERVRAEAVHVCWTYPSLEDYVRMQVDTSLADLYAPLTRPDQRRLRERLHRAFRRFRSGGVVRYPGMVWVVTGRRAKSGAR